MPGGPPGAEVDRATRRGRVAVVGALCALVLVAGTRSGAAQEGGEDGDGAPPGAATLEGTLRASGAPVADVVISVTDAAGGEVGETVSAADGSFSVGLPGAGAYLATLATDTLPEGVTLRDPERATLEVSVTPGQRRVVLFALVAEEGADLPDVGDTRGPAVEKPGFAERLAQSTLDGIQFGLLIAMSAIGLSLVFGTTGLVNFAHGEFVTLGAVVAWYFNASTGGPELPLVLAAAIAIPVTGAVGGLLDYGMLRPLRRRKVGLFQMLVITIGLSLVGRHVVLLFFGGRSRPYTDFTIQEQLEVGPFAITPRDLSIIVLSIVILVGVGLMLQLTRIGKAMRAVSDNVDLAESSGIDVRRVVLIIWVLGAALAAAGGIFFGAAETVSWLMGFRLLLLIFAGVILGGLGSPYGAMVGSLVIGLVTEWSTLWFSPELRTSFALGALILVLLFRPQGIFGTRERVG